MKLFLSCVWWLTLVAMAAAFWAAAANTDGTHVLVACLISLVNGLVRMAELRLRD